MAKQKKKPKKVLGDHKQQGKVFTPPIITALSDRLKFTKWSDDLLPNVVWIGMLFDALDEKRAVYVCENFVDVVKNILGPDNKKILSFIPEYYDIKDEQAKRIKKLLLDKGILDELQKSLYPLVRLYRECPLKFLYDSEDYIKHKTNIEKSLATMKRVVKNIIDRRSRESMFVQTTAVYIIGITGRLKIVKGQSLGNIEAIKDYPDTDESRMVASGIRAALGGIRGLNKNAESVKWCTYFWQHGYEISVCEIQKPLFMELSKKQKKSLDKISNIVRGYQEQLFKEVEGLWSKIKIDISNPIKDEVLGGLIARQARLASVIISNDILWTLDLGRIILRCMVDTHITLAWLIKKGKEEDYDNFIEYGLGQEKLLLEHLKIRIDKSDSEFKNKSDEIEERKNWVNSQLLTDFLPVNVGNWITKNVRKMAEEADCIDIYNLSYTPFSTAVHGMWNTLARINLKFCINPLHKFHRIPSLEEPPIYFGIIIQAAEIMGLSFSEWLTSKGTKSFTPTSSEKLIKEMKNILSGL